MSDGFRCGRTSGWAIGVAALLAIGCTNTPRAGIGEACEDHPECVDGAQCFAGVCSPRCSEHAECGSGYVCRDDGVCERVSSQVGDVCEREIDCGPSQTCQLEPQDADGDGWLGASCQYDHDGTVTGATCAGDADCRSGLCALGHCSEVCADDADCPDQMACVGIPRLLDGGAPTFRGCLLASGRLTVEVPVATPSASVRVPVPSNAVSLAVVTSVDDPRHGVGATRVTDPNGELLYRAPATEDDFYANTIRYETGHGISTLLIPNAPHVPLRVGVYSIDVASFHPSGGPSTQVPSMRVVYKLAPALPAKGTLDVELVFLDLDDHPCAARFPGGLDARAASESRDFEGYLTALDEILAGAGISLGNVVYRDLSDRPDLDALDADELPALLEQSSIDGGLSVFFVRSIDPAGVQALAGGTPGAPGLPGTATSGIAVSASTLCYRDWTALARTTAHTAARQLGLYRNVEPDGHQDAVGDSEPTADNLLFFSEYGGVGVSAGQADVLRRNPTVR